MISKETFLFVYYTSFYFNLFCVIAALGLLKYQSKKDKILIIYLLLSVSFDYLSQNLTIWFEVTTNYHILNLWSFTEFICLWIFYFYINELKSVRKYKIVFLVLFLF